MSDWTCEQVEAWIDLYAAGEADAPTRAAVGRHLKACPSCAESHGQAQQLLGLLDQHFQESERLNGLVAAGGDAEAGAAADAAGPVAGGALAASVLLDVRPVRLARSGSGRSPSAGPQLTAVLNSPGPRLRPRRDGGDGGTQCRSRQKADAVPPGRQESRSRSIRRRLCRRRPRRRRPRRMSISSWRLTTQIVTHYRSALGMKDEVDPGFARPRRPGRAAPSAAPPLADLRTRIAPGATYYLTIHQLAYGGRGAVHYLYWTSPGEYTLTVTLRAWVEADARAGGREVVTTSGPLKIHVRGAP